MHLALMKCTDADETAISPKQATDAESILQAFSWGIHDICEQPNINTRSQR